MENNSDQGLNGIGSWLRNAFRNRWVQAGISVVAGMVGSPAFGAVVASFFTMVNNNPNFRTAGYEETTDTLAASKWIESKFIPFFKSFAVEVDRAVIIETRSSYIATSNSIRERIALIRAYFNAYDDQNLSEDGNELRNEAINSLLDELEKVLAIRDKVFDLDVYSTSVKLKVQSIAGLIPKSDLTTVMAKQAFSKDEQADAVASKEETLPGKSIAVDQSPEKKKNKWLAPLLVLAAAAYVLTRKKNPIKP